jgi:cysteine desulfurase
MSPDDRRTYLDHNATSPLRPEARRAFVDVIDRIQGNASSLHLEGRAARSVVEKAREQVAALAGCSAGEIVLTSGGTESVAAAVRGVADRAPDDRRRIVVSAVEHSAVLESARAAARRGCVVVTIPCGRDGRVDLERFATQLGPDVALAALQLANNETGVLQPVEEVGVRCREQGIPFLVDAVQAAGKLALDPKKLFADLMALSGHKLGGPQGTGALYVRSGIVLAPFVAGGAQERRRRGGTEAVAAMAGFGAAAMDAQRCRGDEAKRLLRLRARIETRLRDRFPQLQIHGEAVPRLPNTVNLALPGLPGETLAIALDLAGFAVSTGSACASGAVEPSHVIRAMGYDEEEARGSLRISLGWSTNDGDVERFLEAFPRVVDRVRSSLA